jgi:hypothetical protein
MGISVSPLVINLVVIDQVDIAGLVRLFVVPENQPPISRDGQAPSSLKFALESMQPPTGKATELIQRLGRFEGEQKLTQFVGHRRRHPFGASLLIEMP